VPRAGRARGQSDGGDRRHSDRQGRGKGGASIDPHGYDGGKKTKGKKRHLLAGTLGPMLHAVVHTAGLQDRDGGAPLMATLSGLFPFLRTLYADAGYQGPKFQAALKRVLRQVGLPIVKRSDTARGFEALPKRRIVERSIAWRNRCRRLATDWENLNRTALAFLRLASIRLMLRRLRAPRPGSRTDSESFSIGLDQ
jgi:transposase